MVPFKVFCKIFLLTYKIFKEILYRQDCNNYPMRNFLILGNVMLLQATNNDGEGFFRIQFK